MRFLYHQLITLIVILFTNVGLAAQTFEIFNGDTINYIDSNQRKQGFWKIFGRMMESPGYQPDQVVEQGEYENSRKQGIWKNFFPNGKIKSEIAYVNSRPSGSYKIYYDNGEVEEEGYWKNNKNVGKFIRKYPNGNIAQEFVFNEKGKRDGIQKWFYENSMLMMEADLIEGKEGKVTEYYSDGSIKAVKVFNDGDIDIANSKTYKSKEPIKQIEPTEAEPMVVVKAIETEKSNQGNFDGNGTHKLYNSDKQISKDGFFKNYLLINGKAYKYDENGILINIELYKNGRYIGDVPLPKD